MLEIAAVVALAGFCMAAGWWLMHGRGTLSTAPIGAAEPAKSQPARAVAAALVKPAQAAKEPEPPLMRFREVKPEKPATPPQKPSTPPPAKPIAPPPIPAEKPTTTLTFQKDILPILQAKCVLCHGDRNKFKGGLDARTLRTLEKGGETGPAINRQDPETSLLWDTVSTNQMPPGKIKVSESEKRKLHDWLVGGGK